MNSRDFALVALAGAKRQALSPVQLQKLLFLLDRNIGLRVGGSGFDFKPYHYGPFDKAVYSTLTALACEGKAEIEESPSSHRAFRLTEAGQQEGERKRAALGQQVVDYINAVCEFVRGQSFAGLVSSIYSAYPEMKVNSVFRGL